MSIEETQKPRKADLELKVEVNYGDLNASFSGDPETVLHSINAFIGKEIPALSLARKLSLNFSAEEVAQKFQDYVRITPEGPRVWSQEKRLSDKEVVTLQLAAQIIAYDTGKASSSWLQLGKIQEATALNPKTLSSRLSELLKSGLVAKETQDSASAFKLTTQGVAWLSDVLNKKQG